MGHFRYLLFTLLFLAFVPVANSQNQQEKSSAVNGVDFECVACTERWRRGDQITPNEVIYNSPSSLENQLLY